MGSTEDSDSTSSGPRLSASVIGLTSPGIALMVIVLLAFGFTAWHPTSRRHLNRVSFRLLVYALISNLIYAVILLLSSVPTGPSAACTFIAFSNNATLMFSGFLFLCMSLNLVLVLIYGVNGRMMEKYYLIGSLLLSLACNLPPLIAGQYGFWNSGGICWFNNPDPAAQLRWMIGSVSFWLLLMAVLELACFIVLTSYMVRQQMLLQEAPVNSSIANFQTGPTHPIVLYRRVVLRIGIDIFVYDVNQLKDIILDLYSTYYVWKHEQPTPTVLRILVLTFAIYALRGFFYALLAATDPSFTKALCSLRGDAGVSCSLSTAGTRPASTHAHVQSVGRSTKRFSFGHKALVRVELESVVDWPPTDARAGREGRDRDLEHGVPVDELATVDEHAEVEEDLAKVDELAKAKAESGVSQQDPDLEYISRL